jgi:alkylation response protein AidB-like acyl-CoA dehydrogenase
MRATQSDDTVLDGTFVPERYIARVVPAGAAGIDRFVLAIFAWALIGFGNIYYSVARRALDVTIETARKKRSIAITRTMAYHAELQHRVAQMGLLIEGIEPHLNGIADDWSTGVDHGGMWPAKLFEVPRGRSLMADRRSGTGGVGRLRRVPAIRPGTPLPRCAPRADPPRELDAHARDRGKDVAWDQPG